MTRFSFSSLRARLLLLGFLAVIPALELIIVGHFEQRQLVIAKAREDTLKVAQFVARDYNDLIEGARQLLVALAQLPEVHSGQNKCSALFCQPAETIPTLYKYCRSQYGREGILQRPAAYELSEPC